MRKLLPLVLLVVACGDPTGPDAGPRSIPDQLWRVAMIRGATCTVTPNAPESVGIDLHLTDLLAHSDSAWGSASWTHGSGTANLHFTQGDTAFVFRLVEGGGRGTLTGVLHDGEVAGSFTSNDWLWTGACAGTVGGHPISD